MIKKSLPAIATLVTVIVSIQACSRYHFRSNYQDANRLMHEAKNLQAKPYLKAHLKNGDVYILEDSWAVDTILNLVTGSGTKYDFNRNEVYQGNVDIPLDSVAIFETNKKIIKPERSRVAALSILAGVDLIFTTICITNPKACFGSCPTFYMNEQDDFHYADAEGFSSAISPSMEYHDIDALNNPALPGHLFSITMKNEALETHCVKQVQLFVYPRGSGERVYHSPSNDFYLCEHNYILSGAKAEEGDVTHLLRYEDRQERFSLASQENLSSREAVYLSFDGVNNTEQLALVLSFRQTLMTTFFIYSAMGYMGDEVGDIFARMETSREINQKLRGGLVKELGKVDVYQWNEQKENWEFLQGFYETGPIAFNRQILPLKNPGTGSDVRLKLVLNKGLWRIDYAGLTNIKERVEPLVITAGSVTRNGVPDAAALSAINHPGQYLISMPGSEYKFSFSLPEQHEDYELFLYSKGYYLEWMRAQWMKDKNLPKLKQMVGNPRKYLRAEARNYKSYEQTMEQQFWNSKLDTKTISYYEQ